MENGAPRYNLDLIISNLLFGANFSYFISLVKNWIPFQDLFFLQVAASAIFFIPFAISSRSFRINWSDFGRIFIVTILVVYGSMYTLLWGAKYTTPISASVISTLGPVLTLLAANIAYGKRIIKVKRRIGIFISIVGAAILLIDDKGILVHGTPAWGNALVLVSVICVAINTVIIRPVLRKLGTLVVMGWYYIIGFVITAPFFMKDALHTDYSVISLGAKFEIGYILIFGTILPAYLLYRGTEKLTSDHTALYRYIQPAMTTVIATIRGQEHITLILGISAVLIFTGIILAVIAHNETTKQQPYIYYPDEAKSPTTTEQGSSPATNSVTGQTTPNASTVESPPSGQSTPTPPNPPADQTK